MQGVSKRRLQTKACIAGAKTFLLLFNIVFWLIGMIFLIIGLWMKVSIARFFEISQDYSFALPSLFLFTGIIMMIVGFFACSCTSKGQPTLLYLLSLFFFFMFILILSSSITGYVYKDNVKESLHGGLKNTLNNYGNGGFIDRDFDRVQEYLECCGVDSYMDWNDTKWRQLNHSIPLSCCRTKQLCDSNDPVEIYDKGCYPMILETLSGNLNSVGLGMLFIALFQLIGVALSFCLAKYINKSLYESMN